ncbi:uncharacterized protein [Miscanthus floridulus]|uniref:uncharacterized protein n=1 Tax=Miscanthus floridulus TaxID=154761 RepID=UPI0034574EB8
MGGRHGGRRRGPGPVVAWDGGASDGGTRRGGASGLGPRAASTTGVARWWALVRARALQWAGPAVARRGPAVARHGRGEGAGTGAGEGAGAVAAAATGKGVGKSACGGGGALLGWALAVRERKGEEEIKD